MGQHLNNSKMAHSLNELCQKMKIWDIFVHLQLVSSIFIKLSSNESILKKGFQIKNFEAGEKSDFPKNVKNYLTLTMRCDLIT